MTIYFNKLPADERVSVRGGKGASRDTLRGFLTRTNGEGPVWADKGLSEWLGLEPKDGFSFDGTMDEAVAEVRRIAEGEPARPQTGAELVPDGMRAAYARPDGLDKSVPASTEVGFWHVRHRLDGAHIALFRNDVCEEYVAVGPSHFGPTGKSNALIDMARAIERHRATDRAELGAFRTRWRLLGDWIKEAGG